MTEFPLVLTILLLGMIVTGHSASDDLRVIESEETGEPIIHPDCVTRKPKVPDFASPGRRISSQKCYEYIWQIKYRIDENQRAARCRLPIQHVYIIGGLITKTGDFPHMGAIGWEAVNGTWIFQCGGTLISPKFLLTAAHCTRASSRDTTLADVVPKIVRLGNKNILDYHVLDMKISRIITHPRYAPPKKYYDIALMEFEEEVHFTKAVQPACLWTNLDDESYRGVSKASVAGWGVVNAGSLKTSPELQSALLDIVDRKKCEDLLRPSCNRLFCGLQDHQLCAGKLKGGVDTCQGDSGGPLQIEITLPTTEQGKMYYVLGVTSFGKGCARADTPGVYTKVASFLDWIESIVWA